VISEHVVYLDHIDIANVSRSENFSRRLRATYTGARRNLLPVPKGARHAHLSPKANEQRNTYQEKPSHHIAECNYDLSDNQPDPAFKEIDRLLR